MPRPDPTRRLRRTLRAARITQEEIAEALGVSRSSVSRYVHGRMPLTTEALVTIRDLVQQRTGKLWTLDAVLGLADAPGSVTP